MTQLADGEWHRLHPASPLLKGGIAFIAILGVIIANLRDRIIEIVFPGACPEEFCEEDPVTILLNEYLLWALLGAAAVLLVIIAAFWASWRMHTFRVTDEVVEVRSGILFRSHRKTRLDRIQGVNINRPLLARIFGAAKLEISAAGADANTQLSYLSGANADELRHEILQRAAGIQAEKQAAAAPVAVDGETDAAAAHAGLGDLARQRLAEFAAPELDPTLAAPASVVTMSPGRLIGSTVLSGTTIFFIVMITAFAIVGATTRVGGYALFAIVPTLFGFGSYLVGRVVKSLRYSIASTPHGVRVGFGLISTSNETLPPGRIHAVQIDQELLWRPADWWTVRVNLASQSTYQGAAGQQNTTILPVGSREEVLRVLELVLPGLVTDETRAAIEAGLAKAHPDDRFTTSPRRARVLRWFSWRRNGFLLVPDALVLRTGAIWRRLTVVPTARAQSVAVHQGPVERALRLASLRAHTVTGPVTVSIGALDVDDASALFRDTADADIAAVRADRTHRWGQA